jgi:hypothetical protein
MIKAIHRSELLVAGCEGETFHEAVFGAEFGGMPLFRGFRGILLTFASSLLLKSRAPGVHRLRSELSRPTTGISRCVSSPACLLPLLPYATILMKIYNEIGESNQTG